MFSGIESLKEEIKTFLKIKRVNIPSENPYFSVTKNKIVCEKEINKKKISYSYEFSKIFSEYYDYFNIYHEVARNCIKDSINENNYTFISYGETNSEKHDLLFSDYNCKNKGIFPRLCKDLFNKKEVFSISLMFVYDNKLFDINDIIKNINNENYENKNSYEYIQQIMDYGLEIKQNSDIIENIIKIKIFDLNQFYNLLNKYNSFFNILQKENVTEYSIKSNKEEIKYPFIFSSSNFIYVIYLYDKNKKNEIISKISFIEFASNDNLITKINNKKLSSSVTNCMFNTKNYIKNSNTIESFIEAIKQLKQLENKITNAIEINNNPKEKVKIVDKNIFINDKNQIYLDFKEGMDNKFVLICKNLCFNSIKTKFRVIGCIYPNVGLKANTIETLDFLNDFQKILLIKSKNLENLENYDVNINLINNENKDNIILNLREDCSILKKNILQLENHINTLIEKNHKIKIKYKKQIDIIKEKFGFEGDINMLLKNIPFSKEFEFINEIKENKEILTIERNKLKNLELENEKIKNENKKLKLLLETRIDTLKMINYFKENYDKEEKDHKNKNEKNQQEKIILSLKKENNNLNQLLIGYRKENDKKSEILQKLPEIIDINLKIKEKIKKFQKDNEKKNKLNKSMININEEKKEEKGKKDNMNKKMFDFLNDEILNFFSEYESKKKQIIKEKQSILEESTSLYGLLMNLIKEYSSIFQNIKKNNFQDILICIDEYENAIKKVKNNINYDSFPITLREMDKDLVNVKNNIFNISNISNIKSEDKLKNIFSYDTVNKNLNDKSKKSFIYAFGTHIKNKILYNNKAINNRDYKDIKNARNINIIRNNSLILKQNKNHLNKSISIIDEENNSRHNSIIKDRKNSILKIKKKIYNDNIKDIKTDRIIKKSISSVSIL